MTILMTDLRNAMREAMTEVIKKHNEDEVLTADLLGAASWVTAEVMLMTDVEMDESVLEAFVSTYQAVKLAQALEDKDSVH